MQLHWLVLLVGIHHQHHKRLLLRLYVQLRFEDLSEPLLLNLGFLQAEQLPLHFLQRIELFHPPNHRQQLLTQLDGREPVPEHDLYSLIQLLLRYKRA